MSEGNVRTRLFPAVSPDAPLVAVNGETGEGEALLSAVRGLEDRDFSLLYFSGFDWDAALSPWPAPAVFPGQAPFSGGGEAYLKWLTEAVEALPGTPRFLALAGYSLAGLLAAWAPFQTPLFSRIASASGSLWYPGFMDFMEKNAPVRAPEKAYFSLGDREARTRNPMLRPVEDHTRAAAERYKALGSETVFELNAGNHFQQPLERLAKAVAWLLAD